MKRGIAALFALATALAGCATTTEVVPDALRDPYGGKPATGRPHQLGGIESNAILGDWAVEMKPCGAHIFLELTSTSAALAGGFLLPSDKAMHIVPLTGKFDATSGSVSIHGGPIPEKMRPEITMSGTLKDRNIFTGTISITGQELADCKTFEAKPSFMDWSHAARD